MFKLLIGILLLVSSNVFAGTLQFGTSTCNASNITSVTQTASGWTANVLSTSTLSAGCANGISTNPPPPPPPPSGATACTQGTTGEVSGYTALCYGTYIMHTPIDVAKGPASYSYKFLFGNNTNDWPGGPFGTTEIFNISSHNFLAIPFTPTTLHTITISEAQTYTPHPVTFAISTQPGVFSGPSVVCAANNLPSLVVTTVSGTVAQCKLTVGIQYWLNIIPATYNKTTNVWTNAFVTDPVFGSKAKLGVTVYKQN